MKKSTNNAPPALPIRFGMTDGSNAHLLVDARGEIIGELFGIVTGISVADAHNSPLCANGVRTAEYLVNAVNSYGEMILALRTISATAQGKRIPALAFDTLKKAGEV
ncbi:hypothetical protein [Rugamonas apoptosis]|uniref:Uncharacterized protein n=1 Tax=Rugamonas apoptosis TaxID=2758570 RepID=A0A7W2F8B2_9BURK|nr:hypothetical protein [Rugamonas apoptosis]MBA5686977.1 hypothetical protein [Rugamonas apoptosis]